MVVGEVRGLLQTHHAQSGSDGATYRRWEQVRGGIVGRWYRPRSSGTSRPPGHLPPSRPEPPQKARKRGLMAAYQSAYKMWDRSRRHSEDRQVSIKE